MISQLLPWKNPRVIPRRLFFNFQEHKNEKNLINKVFFIDARIWRWKQNLIIIKSRIIINDGVLMDSFGIWTHKAN